MWGARRHGSLRTYALMLAVPLVLSPEADRLIELFDRADELENTAEEVDEELAELEARVARQRAELVERTEQLERAEAELSAVDQQLEIAEAELAEAEARYDDARRAHREATAQLRATTRELDAAEQSFAEQVNAAYRGTSVHELTVAQMTLSQETVSEFLHAWARMERTGANQRVHVDELLALRRGHQRQETAAERAEHRQERERAVAERARDSVAELREERQHRRDEIAELHAEQTRLVAALEDDREGRARLLDEVEAELAAVRDQAEHTIRQIGFAGGIVCPVPGAQFVDDWHYARSGGRKHKGNDLFADHGTPVLATADGTVRHRNDVDRWNPDSQRDLGGKTVSVTTEPGTRWYYAHLDEIADDIQPGARVRAGQRLGTVGTTGNARHTPPHLHLGYYRGGTAHNPYPLIAPACR